jgi:hypothetical protein
MDKNSEPVVLELAPLPREQVGPFLLLGVDKGASAEEIEAHWAERIKRVRQRQIDVELGDINWARDTLKDPERRIQADAASLNADTGEGFLSRLARELGAEVGSRPPWQPMGSEQAPPAYEPPEPLPSARDVLAELVAPPAPAGVLAVASLLTGFVEKPLDPWDLDGVSSQSQGAES